MATYIHHEDLFSGLKKFLEENTVEKELIKKGISIFLDEQMYIRDHYCDLCDKRLTENEKNTITVHDFMITCHQHREYASWFQIDLARKKLGLPERTFFVKSFIEAL